MSKPVSGLSRRFNFGKSAAMPLNFGVATDCPLEVEPSNAPDRTLRRSPFDATDRCSSGGHTPRTRGLQLGCLCEKDSRRRRRPAPEPRSASLRAATTKAGPNCGALFFGGSCVLVHSLLASDPVRRSGCPRFISPFRWASLSRRSRRQ